MFEHFLPSENLFRRFLPWGEIGVQLFFVLSGFLITTILLQCKNLMKNEGQTVGFSLRQFYARRFLRIFPFFYGAILLCFLLNIGEMRQTVGWHVTYLSNVGIMLSNGKGFGHSTHFWTLAVEEQFYLIWPLFVLLIPDRYLKSSIVGCILFAPVFRIGMAVLPVPWHARVLLMPACLDTLAAGALLSLGYDGRFQSTRTQRLILVGGLAGIVFHVLIRLGVGPEKMVAAADIIFGRLAWAGVFVAIVAYATVGVPGPLGALLESRPFVFLGRISYGIYVLHHFFLDIIQWEPWKSWVSDLSVWPRFALLSFVSIVAAAGSWYIFEKPLNQLKSAFPYRKKTERATG